MGFEYFLTNFKSIDDWGKGCFSLPVSSWAILSLGIGHREFRPPLLVLWHEDFIAALHVLTFLDGA